MPWMRTLTLIVVAATVVLAVTAIVVLALSPTPRDIGVVALVLAVAGTSVALALLLSARRPHHPLGPLLALNGLTLFQLLDAMVSSVAHRRPDLFAPGHLGELASGRWMLLYLPVAFVFLLFPDGRLPGPRWKVVAFGLPAVVVAFNAIIVAAVVWPGLARMAAILAPPLPVALFALLLATPASLVVRYRRSGAAARRQLRWLVLPALTVPATLLLCWLSYWLVSGPDLVVVGLALIQLTVPLAAAAALLCGERADIDELLVSAATYLMLACGLIAALATAGAVAGLVVARWSTPAAIVVAVVMTLTVEPLRRVLQPALGRWLHPARAKAIAALSDLTRRVHAGTGHPEDVQTVLRQALRDPGLRVWVQPIGDGPLRPLTVSDPSPGRETADEHEEPPVLPPLAPAGSAPVTLAGTRIGVLVPGPTGAPIPPSVARAAAFAIDFARLRAELTLALSEVRASRERILGAGYDARRRLERDLHDGAQQRLVSLGLALRVLQRRHPEVPDLSADLDAAVAEVGTAVAELRQIAHGLRPSALDDGLGPALAQLTRLCPTRVEVTVDDQAADAVAPADVVATTAYFVAAEAVTNAVRHANADRIEVAVRLRPDSLDLRIADDGAGGAYVRPGSGLAGLHDRVAAVGGRLVLTSTGDGTVLHALLPSRPVQPSGPRDPDMGAEARRPPAPATRPEPTASDLRGALQPVMLPDGAT